MKNYIEELEKILDDAKIIVAEMENEKNAEYVARKMFENKIPSVCEIREFENEKLYSDESILEGLKLISKEINNRVLNGERHFTTSKLRDELHMASINVKELIKVLESKGYEISDFYDFSGSIWINW